MYFFSKKGDYMFKEGSINLIVVLFAVIVSAGVVYAYLNYHDDSLVENHENSNEALTKREEAEETFRTEGRKASQALFEEALDVSESYNEEGQIKFRLATIDAYSNDHGAQFASIDALRIIAANENYSDYIRANSVEFIGRIYSRNTDPVVFDYIFDHPAYEDFLVENDDDLTLRHLYEHASSLYPTAQSELRIASWYAREILKIKSNGTDDVEKILAPIKTIIRNNLANVDRDIKLIIEESGPDDSRLLDLYNRRAVVAGYMVQGGDDSFGDPEVLYREVMKESIVQDSISQLGFTKYYYASFLANTYGLKRVNDIKILLSDFHETSLYDHRAVMTFFKNANSFADDDTFKQDILTLAKFDDDFRTLLVELGWSL